MKTLDPKHTETFCRLIELMLGCDHLKIERKPFMPLYIEKLAEGLKVAKYDHAELYSLAHYYTLNGDLMSDPEMTFIVVMGESGHTDTHILPCSFSQADMGIYEESVSFTDLIATDYKTDLQQAHTEFANVWLGNIKEQGFTSIP